MQNASKKAWFLRSKIKENALKIALKTHAFLNVVFRGILGGFGRGLGRVSEALLATFLDFFRTLKLIRRLNTFLTKYFSFFPKFSVSFRNSNLT